MNKGEIEFRILEDGTVKIETGNLTGPLHQSADKMLQTLQQLLGGTVKEEKARHQHHEHEHHEHEHEGAG